MALSLLCDEHIPYPVVEGLRRRGLDVTVAQEGGLGSAKDILILETAQQQHRIVYTRDTDFLRHHAAGVRHGGIFYHHPLAYSIGEAIRRVALACEVYSLEEMENHVEFL
jgi:hypothetical protein